MRALILLSLMTIAVPSQSQTLTIVTLDRSGQASSALALERCEAARIFAAAGVTIVWADDVPRGPFVRLILDIAPTFKERPMPDGAMGLAVEPTVAYVFTGDAEMVARRHRIPATTVLGMVIAHELTHLMLSQAHATTGLMKAKWTASDFVAATNRTFLLDPATAAKLRAAVMARQPPDPQSPTPTSGVEYRPRHP